MGTTIDFTAVMGVCASWTRMYEMKGGAQRQVDRIHSGMGREKIRHMLSYEQKKSSNKAETSGWISFDEKWQPVMQRYRSVLGDAAGRS